MLSGQYPSTLGCVTNGIEMPEDVWTLPRILQPYGYQTANIGKLHFRNHSNRDHRAPHPRYGFDRLILSDEPGCYDDAYIKWVEMRDPTMVDRCRVSTPPAWEGVPVVAHPRNTHEPYVFEGPEHLTHSAFVADQTIAALEQRNPHRPFFAIAGFYAPHPPLNPPARFVEMYDPSTLPLPHFDEAPGSVPWQGMELEPERWRAIKAHYYALVTHVDDQIGRILSYLDESGLRKETLVIFTSDHGEHLGDHGLIQKGPPGLGSCSHVPLIVVPPSDTASEEAGGEHVNPGRIESSLIEAVDLAPTVLDICGVQVPPFFQGRSFSGLLDPATSGLYEPRQSAYIEFRDPFKSSWKSVRTAEYAYTIYTDARNSTPVTTGTDELLYDLVADPYEQQNVAANGDYADALDAMRVELLRRWFTVEGQYPLRTGSY
jgi:arylsulfatase A-like enzyme